MGRDPDRLGATSVRSSPDVQGARPSASSGSPPRRSVPGDRERHPVHRRSGYREDAGDRRDARCSAGREGVVNARRLPRSSATPEASSSSRNGNARFLERRSAQPRVDPSCGACLGSRGVTVRRMSRFRRISKYGMVADAAVDRAGTGTLVTRAPPFAASKSSTRTRAGSCLPQVHANAVDSTR